jgi:hypothetical protein
MFNLGTINIINIPIDITRVKKTCSFSETTPDTYEMITDGVYTKLKISQEKTDDGKNIWSGENLIINNITPSKAEKYNTSILSFTVIPEYSKTGCI